MQMANNIMEMVKSQLQDQMSKFNNSVDTMRDAVEHVSVMTRVMTDKLDEFRDEFHELTD